MLGDFTYCNPTKLYFGEKALDNLEPELRKYGNNVAFVYGGGSIKKSGLYDQVITILNKTGKKVAEIIFSSAVGQDRNQTAVGLDP